MKIIRGTYAVFWRPPRSRCQFHADVPATSPREAATAFRNLFPGDLVVSVRGADGRFSGFIDGPSASQ